RDVEVAPYAVEELVEIIGRAASRDGFEVAADAALILAKASLGIARAAIGLYRELRVRVAVRRLGVAPELRCGATIDVATAGDALARPAKAQRDENGLGPVHRRILGILRRHGRPMALRRLASQADITAEAFRTIYEGALIASRAILPTPRGILATAPDR